MVLNCVLISFTSSFTPVTINSKITSMLKLMLKLFRCKCNIWKFTRSLISRFFILLFLWINILTILSLFIFTFITAIITYFNLIPRGNILYGSSQFSYMGFSLCFIFGIFCFFLIIYYFSII